MKYNLGGGSLELPGYENIDRKLGLEAYPLEIEDGSADEIRASHILEHFSYWETEKVLINWVSKLKPGGLLKIAVPDFRLIARMYVAGEQIMVQAYVLGGHEDENDYHKALFDEESLRYWLDTVGLVDIARWNSDVNDGASLEVSLNLQGKKPDAPVV